ncbi:porin [Chachezhania sediminis]|uniref:porin n=1 Tax=Chachezhania sediminis TaxID=2599291 RepID=UPI00131BB933|nr:porin [Chachezhania sediminis]
MTSSLFSRAFPLYVSQAALAVALIGVAAPAAAAPKHRYTNSSGGTVDFYGFLNPAWVQFSDGQETRSVLADNDTAPSRIGMRLAQPLSDGLTFGIRLETALGFASTSAYNQTNDPKAYNWTRESIRWADLSLEGPWGTFFAGQGSMAADGVTQYNFEGVQMAILNELQDEDGGYFLRQANGLLGQATVGNSFNGLDPSRRGRIRYDTPFFGGFQFRVATGKDILTEGSDDKYTDAQIHYKQEFGTTKVDGGVGYEVKQTPGQPDRRRTMSSIAIEFGSGLNFAVASARQHGDGRYDYVSAGYNAHFTPLGMTAFVIDYFGGEDYNVSGSTSTSWGIGVAQYFDDANMQVYAGYRSYDYQEPGNPYMDADNWTVGMRWDF